MRAVAELGRVDVPVAVDYRSRADQLANFWRELQALGLADSTLVVVLSDHGEEFGEHGTLGHGPNLYDETLAVPLLMRAPGLVPAGTRVPQQVALIDVLPTVLALLDVPPPAQAQGRSLAALLGSDDAARADLESALDMRRLYAEAWGGVRVRADGSLDGSWQPPAYAQRTRELKLIWTPPLPKPSRAARLEAYDLVNDSAERRDLAALEDGRFETARSDLERYAHSSGVARGGAAAMPAVPLNAAITEKLRALGYIR